MARLRDHKGQRCKDFFGVHLKRRCKPHDAEIRLALCVSEAFTSQKRVSKRKLEQGGRTRGGPHRELLAPYRIDIHHHFLPPEHMRRENLRVKNAHAMPREDLLTWSPDRAIAMMDANAIRTAIASISTPGIWFDRGHEAAHLAQAWNDYAAEQVARHPKRFGFFATIPLPATAAARAETTRALDQLKADGIALFTNYDGKYLGDESFVDALAGLDQRDAIVYVHPTVPAYGRPIPELLPQVIEFAFETTRAVVSLLVNGRLKQFPRIRWIFSHSGGCIPMLAGRLEHLLGRAHFSEKIPGGPRHFLQNLYFDLAGAGSPGALAALRHLMPPEHILYGSDAPFVKPHEGLAEMTQTPFSAPELSLIEHQNAERLIPRLAQDRI
jgi:predicted TIM-barrel fold metal-dependent hydrolase